MSMFQQKSGSFFWLRLQSTAPHDRLKNIFLHHSGIDNSFCAGILCIWRKHQHRHLPLRPAAAPRITRAEGAFASCLCLHATTPTLPCLTPCASVFGLL
jgi:hypothetical protein